VTAFVAVKQLQQYTYKRKNPQSVSMRLSFTRKIMQTVTHLKVIHFTY